jgi:hypothetical protein
MINPPFPIRRNFRPNPADVGANLIHIGHRFLPGAKSVPFSRERGRKPRRHMRINVMAGLVALLSMAAPAVADDWVAVKQRGTALVLVDGAWEKLSRGDVVSDERIVRTLRGGRLTLQRGSEIIDLGAETQVRIFDRAGRLFTTVLQDFGTVSVEADVRDVQHFAVKTPHLAAVVKGTRFTVRSDAHGAEVEVERGRVAVQDSDTHQSATVTAGQSVSTSDATSLEVSGPGNLSAPFGANGGAVEERNAVERSAAKETREASREAAKEAREGRSENASSGNSGNSNSGGGNGSSGSDNSGGGNGNSGNGNSGGGNGNSGPDNSRGGNGKKDKG